MPKWFFIVLAVALLALGAAALINADTGAKREGRLDEAGKVSGVNCVDSLGREVLAADEDECEDRWDGRVVD